MNNQSIEEIGGDLLFPYAGITRIRFKEYDLSRLEAPLIERWNKDIEKW